MGINTIVTISWVKDKWAPRLHSPQESGAHLPDLGREPVGG